MKIKIRKLGEGFKTCLTCYDERGCPNIIYNYWGNNSTTRFDKLLFQQQQQKSLNDLLMEFREFIHLGSEKIINSD